MVTHDDLVRTLEDLLEESYWFNAPEYSAKLRHLIEELR